MQNSPPQTTLCVSLAGPFRLWAKDGPEIRLAGEMARRLIAILLLSQHMRRSRASLQLLLWNDTKDPSANLRQLLKNTRTQLGPYADHLRADTSALELVGVSNRTERTDGVQQDFFEDAGLGTEEFEDWYRVEQANFDNLALTPETPDIRMRRYPRPTIGLTSPHAPGGEDGRGLWSDWVADRLRDILLHNAFVEFRDMRGQSDLSSCDMELRVSVHQMGEDGEVSIAAFQNAACKWSQTHLVPGNLDSTDQRDGVMAFAHKAASVVERSLLQMSVGINGGKFQEDLIRSATLLFALTPETARMAIAQFEAISDPDLRAKALFWGAFARMLQCDQRMIPDQERAMAEAQTLINRARDMDPTDVGGMSVTAYFQGLFLGEMGGAMALSDEAVDLAPFSPFAHNVRAALSLQMGDLERASQHAVTASRLGRYGALRHYLSGMEIVLASLQGNHAEAVRLGRALLNLRPTYLVVLRHIVPSLLEIGGRDEALRRLEVLRGLEPDYGSAAPGKQRFPVMAPASWAMITDVLTRHGLAPDSAARVAHMP